MMGVKINYVFIDFNDMLKDGGGANESRAQISPVQVSTARDRFEILRAIEGQ